jgi:hypothetical protein
MSRNSHAVRVAVSTARAILGLGRAVRRRAANPRGPVVAVALLLASSGCFKSYVAVMFQPPVAADAGSFQSEVAGAVDASVHAVALRAPSSCALDPAPPLTGRGVAMRSSSVLQSRCETWLTELEAALATRFTVVRWRDLARAERAGNSTAARDAGAEIILKIAELQTEPLLVSSDDRGAVRLVRATANGEPVAGEQVASDVEAVIRPLVAARYPDGALVGVRVALEIAAVPVAGGEPLWTYRAVVTDGLAGALDARMLLRGRASSWRPVEPDLPPAPEAAPASAQEDPVRARIREIAKAVAADVVSSLVGTG